MSTINTNAVKSVKVVSDARYEELLTIMRTLHGKVMTALQECEITAQFSDNFDRCNMEDYKQLHQQTRALISTHQKAKWELRISTIRESLKSALAPIMSAMETMGAMSTVIPMSKVVGAWPTGTNQGSISKDLTDMGYKVVKKDNDTFVLTVNYVAPTPTVAEVPSDVVNDTTAAAAE